MATFSDHLRRVRGKPLPERPKPARPANLPTPRIAGRRTLLADRAEADICDTLAEWLREAGYSVWFEVPVGARRPDVVGVREAETVGIEAKLTDAAGVVAQGVKIARRFSRAYVALPASSAGEAASRLARLSERSPATPLPGLLAVDHEVVVMREPSDHPRRLVPAPNLVALGERYGADRGGVPSGDQMHRNLAIESGLREGRSLASLAIEYRVSAKAAERALSRLDEWRAHLAECDGFPCRATTRERRAAFAGAHKHRELLLARRGTA